MKGRSLTALAIVSTLAIAPLARAEQANDAAEREIDATAVRFYAPEIGGAARPQFLTSRVLAFQSRIEAKSEDRESVGTQERHLRAAIERLVVEGILAALPSRATDPREISAIAGTLRAGLAERIGGEPVIDAAAAAEGLAPEEVTAIFERRARAALYADRSLSPVLFAPEDQLREVFRTAPHPFLGRRFEDVRTELAAWFADERLRVVESAFLQAARSRIRVVPVRR